jgi:hypothetical protein
LVQSPNSKELNDKELKSNSSNKCHMDFIISIGKKRGIVSCGSPKEFFLSFTIQ